MWSGGWLVGEADGTGVVGAEVDNGVEGRGEIEDVGASPIITGAVRDIVASVERSLVSVGVGRGEARMVASRVLAIVAE